MRTLILYMFCFYLAVAYYSSVKRGIDQMQADIATMVHFVGGKR